MIVELKAGFSQHIIITIGNQWRRHAVS